MFSHTFVAHDKRVVVKIYRCQCEDQTLVYHQSGRSAKN